jgi:hypothetical protein
MRRITRLCGVFAAAGLAAGLTLTATGTASATAACSAWDGTQPPQPNSAGLGDAFGGIAVVSACDVWMVGSDGSLRPLIERWTGGGNWTVVPAPPISTGSLESVAAVSATSVWAVGFSQNSANQQSGLVVHWDGSSWTQVSLPGNSQQLDAVTAVSASDVWAAGFDTSGQPFLAHYDGTTWTTQSPSPVSGGGSIGGLAATSGSDVWAVGTSGSAQSQPLILHWDGTQWSQSPVSGLPPGINLTSVAASSPADAWAVGAGGADGAEILHWDGHSWTEKPVPHPADPSWTAVSKLNSVVAVSANRAYAVGVAGVTGALFTSHSVLLRWDGTNWAPLPNPTDGGMTNDGFSVAAGPGGILWTNSIRTDTFHSPDRPAVAELGTVPNVAGDSQAAATDAMDSAGLHSTITRVTRAGGGCGPGTNGTIIATTPAAGTFTGPPVSMTFCDFPPVVTVPGVVGLADDQAQGTLTSAGLTVGTITLSGNCSFDPGTVIRQTPAAGTTASRGTAVNLTEATPPKPHGCAQ